MNLISSIILIFSNVLVSFFLATRIWKHRHTPGAIHLIFLCIAVGIWSLGFAFEILTPSLSGKVLWVKLEYFGILSVAPTWLSFSIFYTQPSLSVRKEKWRLGILYLIPVISLFLVWTNELHGWFFKSTDIVSISGIPLLINQHGFWFWISVIYGYGSIILGSSIFAVHQVRSLRQYQDQAIVVLFAISLPLITNILHITRLLPGVDLSLFAFNLSGLLFFWVLYRHQFLKFLPIAHQEVMDSNHNGVLILDNQKRIISVNKAALRHWGINLSGRSPLGMELTVFSPSIANCLQDENLDADHKKECVLNVNGEEKIFEVSISPIRLNGQILYGWLMSMQDISDRKRIENSLLAMQTELELHVAERTEDLQRLAQQRKRLFEVSLQMVSTFSFEQVIRTVMNTLQEVLEFSVCIIYWYDAENKILRATEIVSKDADLLELVPGEIPLGVGIAGMVALTGEPVLANQAGDDPRSFYISDLNKPGLEHLVSVPLFFKNEVLGVFQVSRLYDSKFSEEEFELIQLFASQANVAIQNARLYSDLEQYAQDIQQQREQMRLLASRVEQAREMEQIQLAQELHDRIGQNLTALLFNLNIMEHLALAKNISGIQERLSDSNTILAESIQLVRNLLTGLRPPMLDDHGVFSAIKWYADNFAKRAQFTVEMIGEDIRPKMDLAVETALFRIAQEALNNAAKHAQASQVKILLTRNNDHVQMVIQDNGKGFDYKQALNSSEREHWGLITMQERAAAIGGVIRVDTSPGTGTSIEVTAVLNTTPV